MAVRRDLQERGLTLGLIDPDETRHQHPHQLHQPQTTSGATPHASAARAPPGHPPTGPPPPAPRTYSAMPFAVMAPDRYLHGDGASKYRGNLRFTHSQLVQQYQAQVAAPNTLPQDIYVSPYIKPERVYRWGSLDVLDPFCSDFRQMRTMVFDNNLMVSDPGHASAVESINYCSSRVSENIHTACFSPSTVPSLWAAVAIVRPAQRVLVCLTLRARHKQGPVYQDPFQILLHIRRLMSNLQPRLSGILAQFPDIHCPSVRHSHAQYQEEGHRHPCPTILMPEAHRVQWSSLSNKASCHSCLRSCDFSSPASSLFFPTHTLHLPQCFFADRS